MVHFAHISIIFHLLCCTSFDSHLTMAKNKWVIVVDELDVALPLSVSSQWSWSLSLIHIAYWFWHEVYLILPCLINALWPFPDLSHLAWDTAKTFLVPRWCLLSSFIHPIQWSILPLTVSSFHKTQIPSTNLEASTLNQFENSNLWLTWSVVCPLILVFSKHRTSILYLTPEI